ncbi:MAG: PBP1A family penicillin-binding protein [Actinobacteria bacterium]|nr:PBP1A family penicillin-binding protein [Actinomycetota bacterium]
MSSRNARHTTRPTNRGRRFLRGVLFGVLLLIVAALSLLAGFYVGLERTMPSLVLASDISAAQSTKIYTEGESPVLLAELHGIENRELLSPSDIPDVLKKAVVAIEDERFYEHSGVDFFAIVRAVWANITHGEIVQGGSTITQQLIKNAFLTDAQTVDRKLREAALAYQLEKQWSKDKILTEYLNLIYFGEGSYGVESAASAYFGVSAGELTLEQAALLAGLPQAPSAYAPSRDPEAALGRRDTVLNKMYQQGYITGDELQAALSTPLELADKTAEDSVTLPYWVELIRSQLIARYGATTVFTGGLRVYVSVDLVMQKAAEDAVAGVLDQPGDPSAALVAIDVATGRMVAMVGGRDFSEMQFNLATQGRRQPGSAFKPFVLAAALQQGLSIDTTYESGPVTIELPGGPWEVSSKDEGDLTIAQAIARSSNGVFARLIMDVGAEAVAQTAYDMGIVSSLGDDPNPAIALGGLATGVSPLEMAMAYATLATGGERLSSDTRFGPSDRGFPVTIVRVTDAEGNIVDTDSAARVRVLDEGLVTLVTHCLRDVIASGTGTAANIDRPAAGKTGTTQNYADAWFVGYTPDLVAAVWVGYPTRQEPMTDVHGGKVTGGSLPAQIWATFMARALADTVATDFPALSDSGWISIEVCSESHLLPTEYCTETSHKLFRTDEVPTETCRIHVPQELEVPDVVGWSAEEAAAALQEARFETTLVRDATSLEPAGTVVRQDPAAGSELLQGETVVLVVSTGEGIVTVPDLVGLDITVAREELARVGLVAGEYNVADEASPGTVISQQPAPGDPLPAGTEVALSISLGLTEPVSPE